jgi:exoribonuclease-2
MKKTAMVRAPGVGVVVEFMHGNRPQLAWVLEEQSGRLRLFTLSKREMKLTGARVLPWIGPACSESATREEMLRELTEREAERERLAAEVDPMDIWELAQGEVERAPARWFAELLWEDPDVDRVAALGRVLLECKTHFKFQPPDFEIYSRETVERRMEEERARQERERVIGAAQDLFGVLWKACSTGAAARLPALDDDVAEGLRALLMDRLAQSTDAHQEAVWKQATAGLPQAAGADPHLALLLARAWGVVPEHYNFFYDQAGYAPGDAWAAVHAAEIAALRGRVEARLAELEADERPYLSVDGESTRDLDDAFHVAREGDGYRLRLALACPALEWEFGADLDRVVAQRASSVYLPEGDSHMLPEELGTDFLSLRQGEARPSLVLDMALDAGGALKETALELRRVRLAANLSYDRVQAVLAPEGEQDAAAHELDAAHGEALRLGLELAGRLRAVRLARGAVVIDKPEPEIQLAFDPEGDRADTVVSIETKPANAEAQLLVSEFMILANAAVSLWGRERGVPLLHRTQNIALPKEHAGVWSRPEDVSQIVKSLGPAILEVAPKPHASLGVDGYCPISSPLRRYSDFCNEAQVLAVLATGAPRWDAEQLENALPLLSARLEAVGRIQRFRPRYWKLVHYKQQGAQARQRAVVTEENAVLVSVALPQSQIFLRAPRRLFGDKIYPGQEFFVRLGRINPLANEIQILEAWEADE